MGKAKHRPLTPPKKLTAFEWRRRLGEGVTRPHLVKAYDEDGNEYTLIAKLRNPDNSCLGKSHYGGTSLACELICSVIARSLGLPVPDYYIVIVRTNFAQSIRIRTIRTLFENNVGENFATQYHHQMTTWPDRCKTPTNSICNALENIASFDMTVFNGDRTQDNSNLLFNGTDFLLIDHSLALCVHEWDSAQLDESLLMPDRNIRKHCSFPSLCGKERKYSQLHRTWKSVLNAREMKELRRMIPGSWENKKGELDRIFNFLFNRKSRFDAITSQLRRVIK